MSTPKWKEVSASPAGPTATRGSSNAPRIACCWSNGATGQPYADAAAGAGSAAASRGSIALKPTTVRPDRSIEPRPLSRAAERVVSDQPAGEIEPRHRDADDDDSHRRRDRDWPRETCHERNDRRECGLAAPKRHVRLGEREQPRRHRERHEKKSD